MDIVLTVLLDFTVLSRSFCGLEKMNTMLLRTCCCASLGLGFCFDSRRESDFMHTVFPGVVDGVMHMLTVVMLVSALLCVRCWACFGSRVFD